MILEYVIIYMPRKKFTYNENDTLHTCLRVNNKEFLLNEKCFSITLKQFEKRKRRYDVKNYAYTMMDNHMHDIHSMPKKNPDTPYGNMRQENNELVTLGDMKRDIFSYLARKINKHLDRRGCLVEDRSRSIPQKEDNQGIVTLLYVLMNPVNAGKIKDPTKYKYSNIQMYLKGKDKCPEFKDFDYHPSFMALGRNFKIRRRSFLNLLRWALEKLNIHLPWLSGFFGIGSIRFNRVGVFFKGLKDEIVSILKEEADEYCDSS